MRSTIVVYTGSVRGCWSRARVRCASAIIVYVFGVGVLLLAAVWSEGGWLWSSGVRWVGNGPTWIICGCGWLLMTWSMRCGVSGEVCAQMGQFTELQFLVV